MVAICMAVTVTIHTDKLNIEENFRALKQIKRVYFESNLSTYYLRCQKRLIEYFVCNKLNYFTILCSYRNTIDSQKSIINRIE